MTLIILDRSFSLSFERRNVYCVSRKDLQDMKHTLEVPVNLFSHFQTQSALYVYLKIDVRPKEIARVYPTELPEPECQIFHQ